MKTHAHILTLALVAAGAILLASRPCLAQQCTCPNGGHGVGGAYYGSDAFYAHPEYGQPVTLLVAPTVRKHVNYQWGVPSVRVDRNPWQFAPGGPEVYGIGAATVHPPYWPSSTTQLGVYYMRAPW
jgi:hypothetical protein